MKRKTRGGSRAKPPQASTITAKCIISFSIAAVLIGALIISAGGNKRTIPNTPSVAARSSLPASPLGGGTAPTAAPATYSPEVTTPPLDEPLEGGGSTVSLPITLQGDGKSDQLTSDATAPREWSIWTTNATAYVRKIIAQQEAARERRIVVWRIDTYLAHKGSPMQGCGEYYIQNQERTGIPGSLSAGIAEAESTNGMRCYNGAWSHNAWGMIGSEYSDGFASWQEGIAANFDFLVKHFGCPQTMHDCPGYCVGNGTMTTVDQVQWQINAYEPPEGK